MNVIYDKEQNIVIGESSCFQRVKFDKYLYIDDTIIPIVKSFKKINIDVISAHGGYDRKRPLVISINNFHNSFERYIMDRLSDDEFRKQYFYYIRQFKRVNFVNGICIADILFSYPKEYDDQLYDIYLYNDYQKFRFNIDALSFLKSIIDDYANQ